MPTRPLSPHLGVYKFTYTMVTSILNRITGLGLSLGLLLLVYWLAAVAAGERSYARALSLLSTPGVRIIYAAIVIAFCYHFSAGIRHLIWDTGRGLERSQARASARVVLAVSVLLMLLIGYWLWVGGARAP